MNDPARSENLLAAFPKVRSTLPPAYAAIYVEQYKSNRAGETAAASLAQRLEGWLHRQVAADVAGAAGGATLELGAGTLNQLPYEPQTAPYDIVEPFTALYEGSSLLGRIRDAYADIGEVPPTHRYDRITSIAMMEHALDLPLVLARAACLLSPGGVLRTAIPAEGGLLWSLGWMMSTGLEFRLRRGLDYGVIMRHEHVNKATEIETLTKMLFRKVRVRSLGIGRQFSLYRFIEARDPRLDVAAHWALRFA